MNFKTLFVAYAVFDFIWTLISVNRSQAQALANSSINPIYSPMRIALSGAGILLLASAGLWLSKFWGYLIAIVATGWLLYGGYSTYRLIENVVDPIWSQSILRYWWIHGDGRWAFPRLILAAIILGFACISLIRLRLPNAHTCV